jgi:hypothetical protein
VGMTPKVESINPSSNFKMNIFTYTDNKKKEIVFVWYGESIVDADAAFEQEKGYHPIKASHVGCKIEQIIS